MNSIGYQVSVNTRSDKPDVYKLTGSTPEKKLRYSPEVVKKIEDTYIINSKTTEYIYDIETENHHFAAGVGQLVVHNSNYIEFPHLTTAQETWDYALYVADEVTKLFPPPIKLEFEEAIYAFFFILTKKRYMYLECKREGVVSKKMGKKGVLLARRDNSKYIRDVYEGVITKISQDMSYQDITYYLLDEINNMCASCRPHTDFIVTKQVGNAGGLQAEPFTNEKGQQKAKVGSYTVPLLSSDPKTREEQLAKKGADNAQDFYLLCLPAQVQLAERMRRRGQRVDVGTRLEYIVTEPDRHTSKQYEKVESADYLAKHQDIVKIDFMYYLKMMVEPIDQLLNAAFCTKDPSIPKDFVLHQYHYRWKVRAKMLDSIKKMTKPIIQIAK